MNILTLPMLRLLSSKAQECNEFKTASCRYPLNNSRGVLSDEYPFASVSVILQVFASTCIDEISDQQHKG